jgi:uncharacterized protein
MARLHNPLSDCDLKFAKGSEGVFEGYLSVFGNVDLGGDVVVKGAYAETLERQKKQLPPMLLNHDGFSEIPIGIWKSMVEDDHGLRVVGELTPGNPVSEKVFAAMQHGALSGMSIGYRKVAFEENDHGGFDLTKVDLREGSVVSTPMNEDARIDTVKFDEQDAPENWKDVEYLLRDVGFSVAASKALISKVKGFASREAEELRTEIEQLKADVTRYHSLEEGKARTAKLKNMVSNF